MRYVQVAIAVYMAFAPLAMAADPYPLEHAIQPPDTSAAAAAAAGRWLWFSANSYNGVWLAHTGEAKVKLEKGKLDAEFVFNGDSLYTIHGKLKPIPGVKSPFNNERLRKWSVVATVAPVGDYEWEMHGTYVLSEHIGKDQPNYWKAQESLILSDEGLALGLSRVTK